MTPEGWWVFDGTLTDRNASTQRETIAQIQEGILADQLGFNYFFMTEHHFQPEGAEHSPNPILTATAIAAHSRQIRVGQMANILTWHHPVRLAEQAAMLDVISGGRLEFGVARGYQPRETEVLGGALGATVQDQERNRAYFEEAYDIILKSWTQPSFSHKGQFFTIPPSYTKWNHGQTIAYFRRPESGFSVDQALNLGPPDMYSTGAPVFASTTTLREIQLFPRPLQQPHPQVWQPVTGQRSNRWAAQQGVNAFNHQETPAPVPEEHGDLLRGSGETGLAGPAGAGGVQVRLGFGETARLLADALRAYPGSEEAAGGPGAVRARGGGGVGQPCGLRLFRRIVRGRERKYPAGDAGDGRDDDRAGRDHHRHAGRGGGEDPAVE